MPDIQTPGPARMKGPRLLSPKQILYELGIGRTKFYELVAAGAIKTVKIGRRRYVTAEALNEFIASLSA